MDIVVSWWVAWGLKRLPADIFSLLMKFEIKGGRDRLANDPASPRN
jgi:hypothetical protein